MKLGALLGDQKLFFQALREVEPDRDMWDRVTIFAGLPLTKDSDVTLKPYTGERIQIDGLAEILSFGDMEEWSGSFEDRDDPAQALIDYINSLNDD